MVKLEDPLGYLPGKRPQEFAKGDRIYGPDGQPAGLYLAVSGAVQIVHLDDRGSQTVIRLVPPEALFGEASVLGKPRRNEEAIALQKSSVMFWPAAQVEELLDRSPAFALSLAQVLLGHCIELEHRVEAMSLYNTYERVALALLQMAEQLGAQTADGLTRMPSLTHHVIAAYVGTSREIVTVQMNRLRRLAYLTYTRKSIELNVQALREYLGEARVAAAPSNGAGSATLAAS